MPRRPVLLFAALVLLVIGVVWLILFGLGSFGTSFGMYSVSGKTDTLLRLGSMVASVTAPASATTPTTTGARSSRACSVT